MKHLDLQVIEQALAWLHQGHEIWLSTVLSTYGSAPREPGAMLVARHDGTHCGSLSGGCVEDDFLTRIGQGEFYPSYQLLRYGAGGHAAKVELPCGGSLLILVEHLTPIAKTLQDLDAIHQALSGGVPVMRRLNIFDMTSSIVYHPSPGVHVVVENDLISIRMGAAEKLLIAGLSSVAQFCAKFALALGFEVVVCDPREDVWESIELPGVLCLKVMPAVYIAEGECHDRTAVVALTHDPRIDDLTMMEAVRTSAFYIGAMGSQRTSQRRFERLRRIAGLSDADLDRIHAPIGLNLASKTPAQIALAVMADVLRACNGVKRSEL